MKRAAAPRSKTQTAMDRRIEQVERQRARRAQYLREVGRATFDEEQPRPRPKRIRR
jgi:hypothetical protein